MVHFFGARAPSLFFGKEKADFSALSQAFNSQPFAFYPIYILLLISGCYHLLVGAMKAIQILASSSSAAPPKGTLRKKPFYVPPFSMLFWLLFAFTTGLGIMGIISFGIKEV